MSEKQVVEDRYSLSKEGLVCKLDIKMPSQDIKNIYNKKLRDISANYSAPGFRKGKYPLKVLQNQHGSSILQEVAGELAEKIFQEAVKKETLTIAGSPKVDMGELILDKDVTVNTEFECLPEVTLKELSKSSLKKPTIEVSKKDVDERIEEILEQNTEWKTKKSKSTDKDKVIISFVGTVNGEAFEGGSSEKSELIVGEGKMLPEFEAALAGATANTKTTIDLKFPKDYVQKDLAGKKAKFDIEFHEVKEPVKAKLGKSLFKQLGSSATTTAEFRKEVEDKIKQDNTFLEQRVAHKRVLELIEKSYDFQVPKVMIEEESQIIGKDLKDKDEKELSKKAESNIRVSLVLQKYANDFKVSVNEAMVVDYLKKIAPEYIPLEMFVNWYRQDKDRLAKVQVAVLEQEVVAKLLLQYAEKEDKITTSQAEKILDTKE